MNQEEWKERQKRYACWLCNFPGMGNAQLHRLSEACGGPEGVYYAGREQWGHVLTPKQVENLTEYTKNWPPEEKYQEMQAEGIRLVTILDPEYPQRLKTIPDPPFGIFIRGRLPADDVPAVAVIGARECSEYGRYVAKELGTALGRYGVVVVSGMAKGIDGISQNAALEGGGISLGVLGSGVDICYPAQNKGLYERLMKSGAILSTYPNGSPARPQNFPPRNRIVSGLADAVVVIEARVRSGTLITVDMALEQGREVYVVPGRVTDRLSDGCNRLIKQGAGVLLSPESFYEELLQLRENRKEDIIKHRRRIHSPEETVSSGERKAGAGGEKEKEVCARENGNGVYTDWAAAGSAGMKQETIYEKVVEKIIASLPEELSAVYQAVDFYPRTPEEIRRALPEKQDSLEIIPCLMRLCMEELVIQVSPGHFCRKGETV